jgi:hypothetical protein
VKKFLIAGFFFIGWSSWADFPKDLQRVWYSPGIGAVAMLIGTAELSSLPLKSIKDIDLFASRCRFGFTVRPASHSETVATLMGHDDFLVCDVAERLSGNHFEHQVNVKNWGLRVAALDDSLELTDSPESSVLFERLEGMNRDRLFSTYITRRTTHRGLASERVSLSLSRCGNVYSESILICARRASDGATKCLLPTNYHPKMPYCPN